MSGELTTVRRTLRTRYLYDVATVTDEELIEAFRRGDDTATTVLYNRYGRLVFTVALRVLNNKALAEDATQQTFVQAWRAAASFDPNRSFAPWLATIARRVSIDILRMEQHRSHDSLDQRAESRRPLKDTALVSLPPNEEQIETVWRVRAAIDALASDDRELIKLYHLEGRSQSEVADAMNLPVGTIKSRSHRIHRVLATALASLRDEHSDINPHDAQPESRP